MVVQKSMGLVVSVDHLKVAFFRQGMGEITCPLLCLFCPALCTAETRRLPSCKQLGSERAYRKTQVLLEAELLVDNGLHILLGVGHFGEHT